MSSPVTHFEINGAERGAAQALLLEVFGWEIHADNPMNYGLVHTSPEDRGIGGGIA